VKRLDAASAWYLDAASARIDTADRHTSTPPVGTYFWSCTLLVLAIKSGRSAYSQAILR